MVARHGRHGLDEVSAGLCAWLGAVVPGLPCAALGPADAHPAEGIGLRLVGIARSDVPASGAVAVKARYLICVSSGDVLSAHRAFGEIVFASAFEPNVVLCGVEDAQRALAALALAPCTALLIETEIVRPRPVRKASPVLHPLVLELEPVGSGERGAADARVPA